MQAAIELTSLRLLLPPNPPPQEPQSLASKYNALASRNIPIREEAQTSDDDNDSDYEKNDKSDTSFEKPPVRQKKVFVEQTNNKIRTIRRAIQRLKFSEIKRLLCKAPSEVVNGKTNEKGQDTPLFDFAASTPFCQKEIFEAFLNNPALEAERIHSAFPLLIKHSKKQENYLINTVADFLAHYINFPFGESEKNSLDKAKTTASERGFSKIVTQITAKLENKPLPSTWLDQSIELSDKKAAKQQEILTAAHDNNIGKLRALINNPEAANATSKQTGTSAFIRALKNSQYKPEDEEIQDKVRSLTKTLRKGQINDFYFFSLGKTRETTEKANVTEFKKQLLYFLKE